MSSDDDDRFFSPQPNVPGKGIVASYSATFWLLVVGIGVVAGLGGAAFMLLLTTLEHLFLSYHSGTFLDGVRSVSSSHRVLVVTGAGLVAGVGGLLLRRLRSFGGGEVSEAVWLEDGRLALGPSTARGALSIAIVAMGASLGREAAPQLFGAAAASRLCERVGIPRWQRQLLVACGAGAGMAAVYNIPLGGALFALEVLLGTVTLPLVLPALVTSGIATAVAWIYLPRSPTYTIPVFGVAAREIVWALVIGPLAGVAAVAWVWLIGRANQLRPRGLGRLLVPIVVFAALGAVSIQYPALLGNGKNAVQLADVGALSFGLLAVLSVLKPLFTAACLGSGAPGGLFTPTLAFGALFGGTLGHVWSLLWAGTPAGSYAVVGSAAVLAASMQGPLAATVMLVELAHGSVTLMVPLLLAVTGATAVSRLLGAQSIYSARLGEREQVRRRHREAGDPGRPDLDGVVEQEAISAAGSERPQRR